MGLLNNQSKGDLTFLFVSNLLLAFIFFIISFNSQTLLPKKMKPFFYGSVISFGFLCVIIYLFFIIYPQFSKEINPLSIVLICLIALYVISFLVILIGKKINFPLFTIFIVLTLIITKCNSNRFGFKHYVLKENTLNSYHRPKIKNYIHKWILDRKDKIEQAKKDFPVLFISSEGGGSRAGLWSFLIHSYLSEKSNNEYYKYHLFSLTGASGGSVGNTLFYTTAQNALQNNRKINYKSDSLFRYKASLFFSENYLSSSIVGLLGRDLINSVIPLLTFDNRGELLQKEWQDSYKKIFDSSNNTMEEDVFHTYYKNNSSNFVPPLLILNTSHAQSGKYAVISPVDFSESKEFSGFYDFIAELNKKDSNKSITLSEAMRINAAFPYITPAGEIKSMGVFGDAGYYDNIGGAVTLSLIKVFKEVLEDSVFLSIKNKIKLKSILIKNGNQKNENFYHKQKISQLEAPLKILLNSRSGHTKEQINKLDDIVFNLERTKIDPNNSSMDSIKQMIRDKLGVEEDFYPVLPLGRYLSGTAIKSMEKHLESDTIKQKLDVLLQYETIK